MKVGIFTQPLGMNYGGMLQNWALQQVLRKLSAEPVTIFYKRSSRLFKLYRFCRKTAVVSLKKLLKRHKYAHLRFPWELSSHHLMKQFAIKNIAFTPYMPQPSDETITAEGIEAVVIGSDQVWRPPFNKQWLPLMFCDFLKADSQVKAASFAASFGTTEWEYPPRQEAMAKRNIGKFRAISVREDFGIDLVREHFGREAVQTLDPSMLVDEAEYLTTIPDEVMANVPAGRVGVFILDLTDSKRRVVETVCRTLGKEPLYFGRIDPETRFFDPVERWLAAYSKCDFIITDSFHGTAFAINFGKPFISLVNLARGGGRFHSLLSMFNLSDRLMEENSYDKTEAIVKAEINWTEVDDKLSEMRRRSVDFLQQFLNS
ncbi:MAG: polysaccharide pyruvyl transferase family protein [Bacteroidales bacterium]|nr:polysaccharide pyruvyl transferase family protein [Bacteroidales bacterium]